MTSETRTQNSLVQRGAEHYVDALAAVDAFEKEVQQTCAEVYQRYEEELARNMGLDAAECEPFSESEPAKRSADVGVLRPAQKSCNFCLYLSWYEDEGGKARIQAAGCLMVYHKRLRDSLLERFRQENPRCRVSKYSTWQVILTRPIKLEELGSLGEVLDSLVLEWLGYCKSIGGLGLKKLKTP